MTTIYIPTYAGNGPEAVECVACASRTFPEARVIVADDSNSPMPEQYRDACSYGADIVTTDFDRGRNLNGPEAVRGFLRFCPMRRRMMILSSRLTRIRPLLAAPGFSPC
mgnify:CR=1 FL=1